MSLQQGGERMSSSGRTGLYRQSHARVPVRHIGLLRSITLSVTVAGACLGVLPGLDAPARAGSPIAGIPTAALPKSERILQPKIILPHIARTEPAPAIERRVAPVHLRDDAPAMAPFGHVKFCLLNPDHCRDTGEAARPLALTPERMRQLSYINDRVNTRIAPKPDRRGIADDDWTLDPRAGDCEDYALTKQADLIRHGWPAGALHLAIARLPDGEHHTVLIARTDRGDLVLDNLHAGIRDWQATPYRWLMLQSAASPRLWRRIASIREAAAPPAASRARQPLLRGTIAPEPMAITPTAGALARR
jgi:predicted transglutaminase-like cysteine proteinase